MKYMFFFLLVLLVGCKKDSQLTQPCTLKFQNQFISNASLGLSISGGEISLKKIDFEGSRSAGSEVEIEKEFENYSIALSNNFSWNVEMDIPNGTYTTYQIEFRFRKDSGSAMTWNGFINHNGSVLPIEIQFPNDFDLEVGHANQPDLQKDKTYTCWWKVNLNQLFGGISSTQIDNATVDSSTGITKIKINTTDNQAIYQQLFNNLASASSLEIL